MRDRTFKCTRPRTLATRQKRNVLFRSEENEQSQASSDGMDGSVCFIDVAMVVAMVAVVVQFIKFMLFRRSRCEEPSEGLLMFHAIVLA